MFFNILDYSDSSDIVSSNDENGLGNIEFRPVYDFFVNIIIFDGISGIEFWVWVSNSSSIMCNNIWDFVWSDRFRFNFQEFVFSFFFFDLS